ncbi:MAG: glycosyltransferase family 2 protein [Saprospiraceae bacterium]|nr:glycosyltransferase family 2 protein [Saprospiraceae bacterium]
MMTWIGMGCFVLLLVYLGWGVFYQLIFSMAGLFWKEKELPAVSKMRRIAVLIPAYKEDNVIVGVAEEALQQDYPEEKFQVYVIADSLQAQTLATLAQTGAETIEVSFDKSTKSKALNVALEALPAEAFEIMVILDADNIMSPDFLKRINGEFELGHRVVQGCRAAKNFNTPTAVLDGISEAINNHILCKGHMEFGLSARLAGSGMAFDAKLFRRVMPEIDAIGGFDKALELSLTCQGERIYYAEHATIYDEKVSKPEHFSKQRSRWIAAQFHYARQYFPHALGTLLKTGNIDYFNKAMQMLLPPRLITPGVLVLASLGCWFLGYTTLSIAFGIVLSFNIISFLIAMPAYTWQRPYIDALFRLPLVFLYALRSLVGIGKANKKFIHTPHGESVETTK